MTKTLEELYLGEIVPDEQFFYKDKRYCTLEQDFIERYDAFVKGLDTSQKEEFNLLLDKKNEMISLELLHMFIGSFQFGANIVLETFILPNQT